MSDSRKDGTFLKENQMNRNELADTLEHASRHSSDEKAHNTHLTMIEMLRSDCPTEDIFSSEILNDRPDLKDWLKSHLQ